MKAYSLCRVGNWFWSWWRQPGNDTGESRTINREKESTASMCHQSVATGSRGKWKMRAYEHREQNKPTANFCPAHSPVRYMPDPAGFTIFLPATTDLGSQVYCVLVFFWHASAAFRVHSEEQTSPTHQGRGLRRFDHGSENTRENVVDSTHGVRMLSVRLLLFHSGKPTFLLTMTQLCLS